MKTMRILMLAAILALAAAPLVHAADQQATCKDIYQIYETCYAGGKQMDQEGCDYLVQGLGPRLMGESGVSGFSGALSIAMCKRGCEDGAAKKKPLSMSTFRSEFCGSVLK